MKKGKIAVILLICVLSLLVLTLGGLLIAALRAVNHPDRTLFGYRLLLAEDDCPDYDAGDLLLLKKTPAEALAAGDRIVCREDTGVTRLFIVRSAAPKDDASGATAADAQLGSEKFIPADDILGKLEKIMPVAGDILGALTGEPARDDPATETTTPPESAQPPETTAEPTQPTAPDATEAPTDDSTDWLLNRSWFTAEVRPGDAAPEYGVVGEELSTDIFTFNEDGTFIRSSLYYERMDLNALPEFSIYMIEDGTYWGIPGMGFPDAFGTYTYTGGVLTLTYDETFETQSRTEQFTSVQHDGDRMWLDGRQFCDFTEYYSLIALCEAFGIAYQ